MKKRDLTPGDSGLWTPPREVSREEVVRASETVLAKPDLKPVTQEDIFRIRVLEMDWDIGVMVYEPAMRSEIPIGHDGKRVGIFLLHGGMGDSKSLDPLARTLAGKFGFKVASMTFPGRLYLLDPGRDWPGDTLEPDGSARTPLWTKESKITPDQYDLVRDTSKRNRFGTIISLAARGGTEFYHRMAAWPVAFDEAMKETCRRHLPPDQFSAYVHGHSTGGPFAMIASQRVSNILGVIGYGTSFFGSMYVKATGDTWDFPFNYLRLRTWRDTARYMYEGLKDKGYSLPLLMELVFERWERDRKRANFKVEDFIHKNSIRSLEEAARVTARRLNLNSGDTQQLVTRYTGYCRELSGPAVKPVPPILSIHGINDDTVGFDRAQKCLPMFAAMVPSPKVTCVLLAAGVHSWSYTENDLPMGVIPSVVKLWHDAIMEGYFVQ